MGMARVSNWEENGGQFASLCWWCQPLEKTEYPYVLKSEQKNTQSSLVLTLVLLRQSLHSSVELISLHFL